MKRRGVYPFTAIVGQEDMKLSLILNVINPALGGVLIKGEKGTAKSTAVRALAELLPAMETVKGCRFHCDPLQENFLCDDCTAKFHSGELKETETLKMRVVELPVSATEDRVVGTLDVEYAIKHGEKKFEPGLLAQANRNILYVDEINLLDDHVVDVLLDAAAMGVNTVEREGVSYSHPARFVLVGTMNPEEGDIRPQLLDRFALSVTVTGEHDRENRKEEAPFEKMILFLFHPVCIGICRITMMIFSKDWLPVKPVLLNTHPEIPLFTVYAFILTVTIMKTSLMTMMKSKMRSYTQPGHSEPSELLPRSSGHSCFGLPYFH